MEHYFTTKPIRQSQGRGFFYGDGQAGVSRKEAITLLSSWLKESHTYVTPTLYSISGPPKIGKTSVIYHVVDQVAPGIHLLFLYPENGLIDVFVIFLWQFIRAQESLADSDSETEVIDFIFRDNVKIIAQFIYELSNPSRSEESIKKEFSDWLWSVRDFFATEKLLIVVRVSEINKYDGWILNTLRKAGCLTILEQDGSIKMGDFPSIQIGPLSKKEVSFLLTGKHPIAKKLKGPFDNYPSYHWNRNLSLYTWFVNMLFRSKDNFQWTEIVYRNLGGNPLLINMLCEQMHRFHYEGQDLYRFIEASLKTIETEIEREINKLLQKLIEVVGGTGLEYRLVRWVTERATYMPDTRDTLLLNAWGIAFQDDNGEWFVPEKIKEGLLRLESLKLVISMQKIYHFYENSSLERVTDEQYIALRKFLSDLSYFAPINVKNYYSLIVGTNNILAEDGLIDELINEIRCNLGKFKQLLDLIKDRGKAEGWGTKFGWNQVSE